MEILLRRVTSGLLLAVPIGGAAASFTWESQPETVRATFIVLGAIAAIGLFYLWLLQLLEKLQK
jgi:hypothetical protein